MPKRSPRMPLRLRGVYRQHVYELTWWAIWLLLALGWALWTMIR
jgi:hypothetical protein